MEKIYKYDLVNYHDVWFNSDENTWDINNLCKEDVEIELTENYTSADILQALKNIKFLKDSVTLDDIDIQDDYEMIEIYQADNAMPVCRLELNL